MRMRLASVLALVLSACSGGTSGKPAPAPAAPPSTAALPGSTPGSVTLPEHGSVAVGAPVPAGQAEPVEKLLAAPEAFAGKTVLVEGKVRSACSKKGCWMELTPSSDPSAACRIKFKEYSFFVPTNSAGADARVSGEVKVRTLAPEEVAHLESEGGKLAKGPDGTARAVEITATGVELKRL